MKALEVAAGLVFRNGKLLITRRYDDAHQGGLWEFPGGKREPDETYEQCLARELREELGTVVEVGQLVDALTHAYPDKVVHLRFYACRWIKHEPEPLGCAEVAWVLPAELNLYQFPAADARLLEVLLKEASLWT